MTRLAASGCGLLPAVSATVGAAGHRRLPPSRARRPKPIPPPPIRAPPPPRGAVPVPPDGMGRSIRCRRWILRPRPGRCGTGRRRRGRVPRSPGGRRPASRRSLSSTPIATTVCASWTSVQPSATRPRRGSPLAGPRSWPSSMRCPRPGRVVPVGSPIRAARGGRCKQERSRPTARRRSSRSTSRATTRSPPIWPRPPTAG